MSQICFFFKNYVIFLFVRHRSDILLVICMKAADTEDAVVDQYITALTSIKYTIKNLPIIIKPIKIWA